MLKNTLEVKNGPNKESKPKDMKTSNSIKNIKKNLFDLTRNESKKFMKPQEEAKSPKPKPQPDVNEFQKQPQFGTDVNQDNINASILLNAKKFVEVTTQEVIYLTTDGCMYTEDPVGKLQKLDNLNSLAPKCESPQKPKKTTTEPCNQVNENKPNLTLNLNERLPSKPENIFDKPG